MSDDRRDSWAEQDRLRATMERDLWCALLVAVTTVSLLGLAVWWIWG